MKKKSIQSKKQERLRGVMKPVKRGIQVKGSWKAVDLDPSLFSEEDMGGLVCFEELTDYRLVDSKVATKQKDKVAKKRKARNVEGDDEGDEGVGGKELETVAKKKKKRDKKKEKAGTSTEGEDDHLKGDEAQGGHVECEGENNQTPLTVLKKNKKKSKVKKEKEPIAQMADGPVDMPSKVTPPAKKQVKNWAQRITSSLHQDTDLSAWKDLFVPQPVLRALGCLGFSSPTPIQALALPSAIRDHMDILGAAETGSGKTLAFGIPMIHTILEWKKGQESGNQECGDSHSVQDAEEAEERESEMDDPNDDDDDDDNDVDAHIEDTEGDDDDDDDEESGSQTMGLVKVIENVKFDFMDKTDEKKALVSQKQPLLGLVLTPTRELAVQVKHHIDAVAQFTGIKTAIIVGGMAPQKQNRVLKRWPEIVIATPGRLWELIREGHPHLQNLKQLRSLVIDEADRMVEKGHFAELENLLEMLNSVQFNPGRQTFVFSATLTMVHQLPTRLLQKKKGRKLEECSKLEMLMEKVGIKAKPKVIDLTRKEATAETLTETRIHCDKDEKDFYLYYFLQQYPGRTMVFANSIDCIKRLTSLLTILEGTALSLHANMHQKQRLKNLERFAEKDSCVLLTTDVAARGLDIPDVQHVIHYQVPRTSETYVHRSGRTARATKEGLSLLLVSPEDTVNFKKIYRTLGKEEDLPVFPIQTKCMAEIKERVNLARKIEKIEYYNSREKHHDSWFKKAAEAMDLELDDDVLLGKKRAEGEDQQHQKMLKGLKRHLKHLLQQPIFRNMMKTKYPTQMGKLVLPELPLATQRSALESLSAQRQEVEKKVCKKKQLRWRKKKQQQQDD